VCTEEYAMEYFSTTTQNQREHRRGIDMIHEIDWIDPIKTERCWQG
jgi:ribonuclease PH